MSRSAQSCVLALCDDTFFPTATYIEFIHTSINLSETVMYNEVKVRRRGNLQRSTVIQCILKGGTAVGSSDHSRPDLDFYVTPEPERVTFGPHVNQTGEFSSSCLSSV